jgi:hypothetical protein
MFLCDECREKDFTNGPSFVGSRGPCEGCGRVRSCSDIQSAELRPKRKKKVPA